MSSDRSMVLHKASDNRSKDRIQSRNDWMGSSCSGEIEGSNDLHIRLTIRADLRSVLRATTTRSSGRCN